MAALPFRLPGRGDLARSSSRAGWQSGHAAACKAVYAGSIPTPASKCFNGSAPVEVLEPPPCSVGTPVSLRGEPFRSYGERSSRRSGRTDHSAPTRDALPHCSQPAWRGVGDDGRRRAVPRPDHLWIVIVAVGTAPSVAPDGAASVTVNLRSGTAIPRFVIGTVIVRSVPSPAPQLSGGNGGALTVL